MFKPPALKSSEFLLLAIAFGLIAIHLTLVERSFDASLLGNSALYWVAVATLMSNKRGMLKFASGVGATVAALGLISLLLIKSSSIVGYDPFLRVFPLVAAIALGLLASGFKGLRHYWQECLVLCFLVSPPTAMAQLFDISEITAKFSAFLLWYVGFDVHRQGLNVLLPGGGIEVYPGCSGLENMLHLAGLAIVFLMLFPTRWVNAVLVPIVAIAIAYWVNGIRVAVLAVLAASSNESTFEYWHKGDGSLIFSTISVLLFGCFCLAVLRHSHSLEADPDLEEEPELEITDPN